MANNFFNAIRINLSSDSTLPTIVYEVPTTKKAIVIELDVANKSTAGVTVTVQIEDESQNTFSGTTRTIQGVNNNGTLTTNSAHGLIVNDRVKFHSMGTAPSFTNASLPPSGDTSASATRMYYIQSASNSVFTIAESKSASAALTFDSNGASVLFTKVHLADIVRDAPIPVGGSLKVISGQKLVLESINANVQDKLYAYASGTNSVDAVASVLQEVS